jgi:hypothetical protein
VQELAFGRAFEQARHQLGLGDDPGGIDGLVAEVGMIAGDTLAPAGQSVGVDLDQEDAARGLTSEAGLEGVQQRHLNL